MKSIKSTILFALFSVVAAAAPAFATVPEAVTYAGSLQQGNQPADGTFSAVFDVFDAPSGGTRVFEQVEPNLAVSGGELVVDLGRDPSNTLSQEILDGGNLFLQVTLNGETLEPRVAFTAVPYARRAELAESAETADLCNDADALQGQSVDQILARVTAGKGLAKNGEGLAVAAGGITAVELATGSVTAAKIANASVDASKIQIGGVNSVVIQDRGVNANDLALGAVREEIIFNGAVTTNKIANASITAAKALNGVNVFEMPKGCGGALVASDNGTSTARCFTNVCRNDLSVPNYLSCDGSCPSGLSTHLDPVACTVSTSRVGTLLR